MSDPNTTPNLSTQKDPEIERQAKEIMSNKRLAWSVVDRWVKDHDCLLVPKDHYNKLVKNDR